MRAPRRVGSDGGMDPVGAMAARPRRRRRGSAFVREREAFSALSAAELPAFARMFGAEAGVFMYLRQCAGATGVCWPSTRAIAEAVGVSQTQTRRALAALRETGQILRSEGRGSRADRYVVRRLPDGAQIAQLRAIRNPAEDGDSAGGAKGLRRAGGTKPAAQPTRKKRGRRKRRESDRTAWLPCVTGLEVAPPPPEEKPAGPKTARPAPARAPIPSGSGPRRAGDPQKEPIPSGSSLGGGGAMIEEATAALRRLRLPLALWPELLRDPRQVVELAAIAERKHLAHPGRYLVAALLRGKPKGPRAMPTDPHLRAKGRVAAEWIGRPVWAHACPKCGHLVLLVNERARQPWACPRCPHQGRGWTPIERPSRPSPALLEAGTPPAAETPAEPETGSEGPGARLTVDEARRFRALCESLKTTDPEDIEAAMGRLARRGVPLYAMRGPVVAAEIREPRQRET